MEVNNAIAEKSPETQFSMKNLNKTREKYAGKLLADNEVIDLVMHGDLNEIDTIVQWVGSGISDSQRPISRFANILERDFDGLKDEQKEAFLLNGLRFAVGDFRKMSDIDNDNSWKLISGSGLYMPGMQNNVGELLNCMLKFTNNDVQVARHLLAKAFLTNDRNMNAINHLIPYSFYRPQPDSITTLERDEESKKRTAEILNVPFEVYVGGRYLIDEGEAAKKRATDILEIQKKYLTKNSKIRLLAFWLDVYIGGWRLGSTALDGLLEDLYPKSDAELKTQIMIFIKESLFARKIPKKKYFMVERIADRELKEVVKTQDSSSSLASESGVVKRILETDRLIEQTKNGKIAVGGLVSMLEKHPSLLGHVSDKELQMALDKTKDHGLSLKIIDLIKIKQAQREIK